MLLTLKVITLDERIRSFELDDETTIKDFKIMIAESIEITAKEQCVIFNGHVLNDDKPLKEFHLDKKVLHVIHRPLIPKPNTINTPPERPETIEAFSGPLLYTSFDRTVFEQALEGFLNIASVNDENENIVARYMFNNDEYIDEIIDTIADVLSRRRSYAAIDVEIDIIPTGERRRRRRRRRVVNEVQVPSTNYSTGWHQIIINLFYSIFPLFLRGTSMIGRLLINTVGIPRFATNLISQVSFSVFRTRFLNIGILMRPFQYIIDMIRRIGGQQPIDINQNVEMREQNLNSPIYQSTNTVNEQIISRNDANEQQPSQESDNNMNGIESFD